MVPFLNYVIMSEKIFFYLFISLFSFASLVFCSSLVQTNNIKTKRILTLQKQAIKVMYFSDYQGSISLIVRKIHYFNCFSSLSLDFKILSFFNFIKYLNVIFVYKYQKKWNCHHLYNTFNIQRSNKNNRVICLTHELLQLPFFLVMVNSISAFVESKTKLFPHGWFVCVVMGSTLLSD